MKSVRVKPWMRAFARWHARLPKSHWHTLCPRCRKPSDLGFCSTCGLRGGDSWLMLKRQRKTGGAK